MKKMLMMALLASAGMALAAGSVVVIGTDESVAQSRASACAFASAEKME